MGVEEAGKSDYTLGKWMKPTTFAANMKVLLTGGPEPESRDELAAWLKTNEGRDAYKAQQAFESLNLEYPTEVPELTLRLGLEMIKKNSSNLRLLKPGMALAMKGWAKACTAFVRYGRAIQATMRIGNNLTDFKGKSKAVSNLISNYPRKEELYSALQKDGKYDTCVEMMTQASLDRYFETGKGVRVILTKICMNESPSSPSWMATSDAESLLGKVEGLLDLVEHLKVTAIDDMKKFGPVTVDVAFLRVPEKAQIQVDMQNALGAIITSQMEAVKNTIKKGRVPAYLVHYYNLYGVK